MDIEPMVKMAVSGDERWYVDTHESCTYVGIESATSFNSFIGKLQEKGIEYFVTIDIDGDEMNEVRVWV